MMSKTKFNGKLELNWISISEKLPLSEFKNGEWSMITDVFILIVNEEDLNKDPELVQIQFSKDINGNIEWQWDDGTTYPECHIKNIKYWCYPPTYMTKDIIKFKSKILSRIFPI